MIFEHKLETPAEAMISITKQVKEAIAQSKVTDGICVVYCPHTTAGITINENSDPHVVQDILLGLANAFPRLPAFRHDEGNWAAHLKASAVGSSAVVPIANGRPLLGVAGHLLL